MHNFSSPRPRAARLLVRLPGQACGLVAREGSQAASWDVLELLEAFSFLYLPILAIAHQALKLLVRHEIDNLALEGVRALEEREDGAWIATVKRHGGTSTTGATWAR